MSSVGVPRQQVMWKFKVSFLYQKHSYFKNDRKIIIKSFEHLNPKL
jgi:hypothetical protein